MRVPLHIVSLSDTHGIPNHTHIPTCDVVTISGDFSELQLQNEIDYNGRMCDWIYNKFIPWMMDLPCKRVIFIPGNHDFITEQSWFEQWFSESLRRWDDYYMGLAPDVQGIKPSKKIVYLCHSQYTYEGYTFYGCPVSDIHGWAWPANDDYIKYMVPEGVDIMLVHQAPNYMALGTADFNGISRNFGSDLLMNALQEQPEYLPKLLLCGHIHSGNHKPIIWDIPYEGSMKSIMMANVSTRNEDYHEWFYARNFKLIDMEDEYIQIETWVSPSAGPSEIEQYNDREIFQV